MSKEMRKVRTGTVVRTKSDKTTIVEMVWKQRHRLYRKQMRRVARFYVHDPLSQCQLGDIVRIQETRPISKTKRWRLLEILERHLVAEVRPIELEADADVILAPEAQAETEEIVDESASEEESDDDETEEEDESQEESEEDEPEAADEVEEEPTAEEKEEQE